MLKVDKDSIVAQSWFAWVTSGKITIEQVPTMFGIREAVQAIFDDIEKAKKEAEAQA